MVAERRDPTVDTYSYDFYQQHYYGINIVSGYEASSIVGGVKKAVILEKVGCDYRYHCRSSFVIKGTVSRDGYFFLRSKRFNQYFLFFCVFADGFQGLLKAFQYPLQSLTFYLLL
jgi:hypothetical protein